MRKGAAGLPIAVARATAVALAVGVEAESLGPTESFGRPDYRSQVAAGATLTHPPLLAERHSKMS